MSYYGIVRKSQGGTPETPPPAFESGHTTVYVRSNFVRVLPKEGEENGFDGWQYDEIAYTHAMYVEVLRNENLALKLAIAELAEGGA